MNVRDDELALILQALDDAAAYRLGLAASCPGECAEHGQTCDTCGPDLIRADDYDRLAAALADGGLHAGPLFDYPPARRPEHDVDVRDGLL